MKIKGEVFRPSFPNSGHVYFTLKDQDSSISAVIWRYTMPRLKLKPEEGMEVICSGKITTFSGQSRYQIIIDEIELAGQGALLKKLEERRQKFLEEGLFKAENKKNIPFLQIKRAVIHLHIHSTYILCFRDIGFNVTLRSFIKYPAQNNRYWKSQ